MSLGTRLLGLALSSCLLWAGGCEQGALDEGGNDDKSDLIDDAPRGQTSFGLELDLINQFSYALWNQQAFQVQDDESMIPEEKMSGELSFLRDLNLWLDLTGEARLPPVIDMSDTGFSLQVGEFHIELVGGTDIGTLSATAVIGLRAEVDVRVSGGRLLLTPRFDDEDIKIDLKIASFAGLKAEAMEDIVESVAPGFVDMLIQRIESLPIPSMDLHRSGFDRVLGLNEAQLKFTSEGAIMQGTLGDVNPDDTFETVIDERAPLTETAPALAECQAPDPGTPGLEGDCCFADDGSEGVCTDLDPDGDGAEESFCPTGMTALRRKCPSAPGHVKCCIYP
jgi:hypothetical protein